MYDTISQVFVALFVSAYLALLAALAWWALGGRLRSAMQSNVVKSGTATSNRYSAPSSGHNWKG